MSKVSYAPNVTAGIGLLNDHFGDESWKSKIDLDELDLKDNYDCVLGQVFGNFHRGLSELQDDSFYYGDRYEYGYSLPLTDNDMSDWKKEDKEWGRLTKEWRKQLSPPKPPFWRTLIKALARRPN